MVEGNLFPDSGGEGFVEEPIFPDRPEQFRLPVRVRLLSLQGLFSLTLFKGVFGGRCSLDVPNLDKWTFIKPTTRSSNVTAFYSIILQTNGHSNLQQWISSLLTIHENRDGGGSFSLKGYSLPIYSCSCMAFTQYCLISSIGTIFLS